jgi:NADH-quinone oxidoreductase subunit M
MLNLLILIPVIAALAILIGAPARKTALGGAVAMFVISLFAFLSYDKAGAQFQFISQATIAPAWDLKYLLAADGLSLVMLLLTGLVTLAAVWVTPVIEKREHLFYACVMFVAAGVAGAFASQDLFFFYAFPRAGADSDVPADRNLGNWRTPLRGLEDHDLSSLGELRAFSRADRPLLRHPAEVRTLDMMKLQQLGASNVIPPDAQGAPYLLLLIGFGILVSLFPFHTWAPAAYASAPTPAAMLHAGVLKKFGLYGLLRLAVPLLPEAAQRYSWLLLVLLVGNIIYVGLATLAQRRLDLMLGYSSVMHMGYIFLGIASLNIIGLSGASLLMFAHGLSIAALFAVAGQLRLRCPSLNFDALGGLAKPLPFLSVAFGLAAFASIGLPGFANFASELMVFFGAWRNGPANLNLSGMQIATVFALWGVVISAVYMLRAYRAIFMGEAHGAAPTSTDPAFALRIPVLLLLAALLITGFFPETLLGYIKPSVEALLK